jgi:hypothetical protein
MTGMARTEFLQRFSDDQEIGRECTDARLEVYYDNGQHVGRWLENRRTTQGHGELIPEEHAATARHWSQRLRQQESDAAKGRNR